VPSLSFFAACHPSLRFSALHSSRLPTSVVREWTLARCGHHPFADGRSSRHAQTEEQFCLCGGEACTLLHALRACPLFATPRCAWTQRLSSTELRAVSHASDEDFLYLLFASRNAPVFAHVVFVAEVCHVQRSLSEGLEARTGA
jgi:hypothetical protein